MMTLIYHLLFLSIDLYFQERRDIMPIYEARNKARHHHQHLIQLAVRCGVRKSPSHLVVVVKAACMSTRCCWLGVLLRGTIVNRTKYC